MTNGFDGFTASKRELGGSVEVRIDLMCEGLVEDSRIVARFPSGPDGLAQASRVLAVVEALASYFSCLGTLEELKEPLTEALDMLSGYEVQSDWKLLATHRLIDERRLFAGPEGKYVVVIPEESCQVVDLAGLTELLQDQPC